MGDFAPRPSFFDRGLAAVAAGALTRFGGGCVSSGRLRFLEVVVICVVAVARRTPMWTARCRSCELFPALMEDWEVGNKNTGETEIKAH